MLLAVAKARSLVGWLWTGHPANVFCARCYGIESSHGARCLGNDSRVTRLVRLYSEILVPVLSGLDHSGPNYLVERRLIGCHFTAGVSSGSTSIVYYGNGKTQSYSSSSAVLLLPHLIVFQSFSISSQVFAAYVSLSAAVCVKRL